VTGGETRSAQAACRSEACCYKKKKEKKKKKKISSKDVTHNTLQHHKQYNTHIFQPWTDALQDGQPINEQRTVSWLLGGVKKIK
jgi:hypothetical protein